MFDPLVKKREILQIFFSLNYANTRIYKTYFQRRAISRISFRTRHFASFNVQQMQ